MSWLLPSPTGSIRLDASRYMERKNGTAKIVNSRLKCLRALYEV